MNGRDPVVDPCCGHCLCGDHRRCYRGQLGCWCADRDHVDDEAMRDKQRAYVYPEPDVFQPVKRRRVEVERPAVEPVEHHGPIAPPSAAELVEADEAFRGTFSLF